MCFYSSPELSNASGSVENGSSGEAEAWERGKSSHRLAI